MTATLAASSSSTASKATSSVTAASLDTLAPHEVDSLYRPFLATKNAADEPDWTAHLELDTVRQMVRDASEQRGQPPIKVLVLYGSLRERSFSRLTAYEAARILALAGADVRVFDPTGLPIKDGVSEKHPKVLELRALSDWSDSHFWVSPEQHGTITAVFKNQIDWIPLSVGSVRPTQGRTLGICQVNGGSQSFNTVNVLRQLGRWCRMWTIPNQSSIPKAWTQFTSSDRLMPSSNRDRLVDVCEELVKATLLLRPYVDLLGDRFSEREEKREHGRLRTQAETEAAKKASEEEKRKVDEQAKRGSEVA
ncbi:uncharacterized protein RHOBADRAFT_67059 [Rhodotorula graminis WP1]|uniref:NADPH-dependent FMN reductase-like domain-containing protein n=1 Tax=Rhodotorula graminis (strain WP1) TaxID=578459 RepID=A0A0P9EDT2_RHOGW|nr:uncharacterized protein RHOBADRAFT_67059 [Rhodotorula graminis WP1]KPV71516.1 hypothetical protein RHOBADRAFT_67059 [Rhodotorula graminis WP1]